MCFLLRANLEHPVFLFVKNTQFGMNPLEEEKFLKVLCGVPASFQAHTEVGNLRKELLPEIEKKVDEKTVELEFAKVQN